MPDWPHILCRAGAQTEPRIWISKPSKSRVKKFVCRRSVPTGALSVEGPTENKLCRTIMVSSHPLEPLVNQRRLPDAGPGDDSNDVDILVCPRTIQKSDILLSTKNITSGNGQPGYGNLLRCKSSWRLASSCTRYTRSSRRRLLQALTSDSTPCVDSAGYSRYTEAFAAYGT